MKASQLMRLLKRAIKKEGDLELRFSDPRKVPYEDCICGGFACMRPDEEGKPNYYLLCDETMLDGLRG